MSTLGFQANYRRNSSFASLRLPDDTTSGGLLIEEEHRTTFVLFAEEVVEEGAEVVVPPGRRFEVEAVYRGDLNGQPVTALEVRPSAPEAGEKAG